MALGLVELSALYKAVAHDSLIEALGRTIKSSSSDLIARLNKDLAAAKAGDSLLGIFTVVSHANQTLVLQFRKASSGTLGLARIRFKFNDQIRVINGNIQVDGLDILSIMLDVRINASLYKAELGFGWDNSVQPTYRVGRALIDLKTPNF